MAFESSFEKLGEIGSESFLSKAPGTQFNMMDFVGKGSRRGRVKAPAFWEGATGAGSDMVLDPISGSRYGMGTPGAQDVMSKYMGVGRYGSPSARSMTAAPASQSYFRGDVHPFAHLMGYEGGGGLTLENLYGSAPVRRDLHIRPLA
tara:strand:- start:5408 stop:5848 length:441 start_codon:yes stop_codon:yes gene_type:complete